MKLTTYKSSHQLVIAQYVRHHVGFRWAKIYTRGRHNVRLGREPHWTLAAFRVLVKLVRLRGLESFVGRKLFWFSGRYSDIGCSNVGCWLIQAGECGRSVKWRVRQSGGSKGSKLWANPCVEWYLGDTLSRKPNIANTTTRKADISGSRIAKVVIARYSSELRLELGLVPRRIPRQPNITIADGSWWKIELIGDAQWLLDSGILCQAILYAPLPKIDILILVFTQLSNIEAAKPICRILHFLSYVMDNWLIMCFVSVDFIVNAQCLAARHYQHLCVYSFYESSLGPGLLFMECTMGYLQLFQYGFDFLYPHIIFF